MRNFEDKICRENQNTLLYLVTFFPPSGNRAVYNVEKYCIAWQATDDNVAHAH
jgi:hypothetical protein